MEKYITKKVEKQILQHIVCDMCGDISPGVDWTSDSYKISETTIHQKEGDNYPDFGEGTEYKIDLCPKCFKEKLIPWLEEQGCVVEQKEWEW